MDRDSADTSEKIGWLRNPKWLHLFQRRSKVKAEIDWIAKQKEWDNIDQFSDEVQSYMSNKSEIHA